MNELHTCSVCRGVGGEWINTAVGIMFQSCYNCYGTGYVRDYFQTLIEESVVEICPHCGKPLDRE